MILDDPSHNEMSEKPEPHVHVREVNSFIDKISLQFLLNKTHYQKYLAKTDPQLYAEKQDFLESCSQYRRPIVDMTAKLLDNPDYPHYSREVCDAFDKYAQTLIRYLEVKEKSDSIQKNFDSDGSDEDMLFPDDSTLKQPLQKCSHTLDRFVLRK
jgi:hypothetical protein